MRRLYDGKHRQEEFMNQPLAYIHPSAKIADNVVIEPFSVIGKNVTIEEGTWIGPNVNIFEGAIIGKNCKIQSHTFICEGVEIGDEVFVGHGVIYDDEPCLCFEANDGGVDYVSINRLRKLFIAVRDSAPRGSQCHRSQILFSNLSFACSENSCSFRSKLDIKLNRESVFKSY